jgi:hypothetical protein
MVGASYTAPALLSGLLRHRFFPDAAKFRKNVSHQ